MPSEYFANIGHSPNEMITFLNEFKMQNIDLPEVIISGGITNPIEAHKNMLSLNTNSIVGMASELLKYALLGEEELDVYINELRQCFKIAKAYIK